MKKFISLLLAAILVFSAFSAVSLAADEIYNAVITVTYEQTTAREMLKLINDMRESDEAWYWNEDNSEKIKLRNLDALTYDYQLERTAMQRAAEIAVSYSHTRPNGERCFTAYEGGYSWAGENIAYGYRTFESVFEAWSEKYDMYDGQGHRRNMLSTDFTAVGIGHVILNGVHYWVQEFRSPTSSEGYTEPLNGTANVTFPFSKSLLNCGNLAAEKTELSLGLSGTENLPKITYTVNGRTVYPTEITANSQNPEIAMAENGKVTATGAGVTELTVYAFGESAKIKVIVHPEKGVHCFDEGVKTLDPTCTKDGSMLFTCTVCGEQKAEPIPAIGHNYGEWTKLSETEHQRVCENDKSHVETSAHSFGEWVILEEATKEKTGLKEHTCTLCGETQSEIIPVIYKLGDADTDGEVSTKDARIALRIAVELDEAKPGSALFLACDVDRSGDISTKDARLILRAAVGLDELE